MRKAHSLFFINRQGQKNSRVKGGTERDEEREFPFLFVGFILN
jgi:hypothetical protein